MAVSLVEVANSFGHMVTFWYQNLVLCVKLLARISNSAAYTQQILIVYEDIKWG
jgi:hypothetical protein